jgi:AcrR family transcriptional regulator
MTIEAAPGLRERKRLATKRAIEFAAIRLVAEHGLESLTVDEIVNSADVSARTFFNYFSSKEAALVGAPPKFPDDESLRVFIGSKSQSIFGGLSELLVKATVAAAEDRDLTQLRRSVLKMYPELFAMRLATMRQFEEELGTIVTQRLRLDDPELARDPEALQRKAKLITLVAFAAVRHAWACWADSSNNLDLSIRLEMSFAELQTLLAPADIH